MDYLEYTVYRVQTLTMKNIILSIVLTAAITSGAFANITPETKIINTDRVTVIAPVEGIFSDAKFNEVNETMHFTTKNDISVIQIFNKEGELEFQLPVMSNDVQLNTNLFGEGDFKIGFVVQGENQVHYTKVNIK